MSAEKKNIGILSDTHGLLRKGVVNAFKDVGLIVHAGDIDNPTVLEHLQRIAPVVAVRGNMDRGDWAEKLSNDEVIHMAGKYLYVIHDIHGMDFDPAEAGFAVVISGHSHRPSMIQKDGMIFLNPGSAGPKRFNLPATVGRLTFDNGKFEWELIDI